MPGVVSLPHGWGHDAPGARLGVAAEHAASTRTSLADEGLVDALAGNAVLNGIPVAVAPVPRAPCPRERRPDFAALGLLDGLDGRGARVARSRCCRRCTRTAPGSRSCGPPSPRAGSRCCPPSARSAPTGSSRRAQVAEEAGVDLATLEAVRRASGLAAPAAPTSPRSATLDVAGAPGARPLPRRPGCRVEGLIEASRVFGEAAAHAAAAAGTLANAVDPAGGRHRATATRCGSAAATRELTPPPRSCSASSTGSTTARTCASRSSTPEEIAAGRRSDVHEVSVGFCDLVGFTRLGEGVPAADLGAIATRLAALAADVAEPPVRLVKTIGDAVMFVAPEPRAAARRGARPDGGGGRREGEGFPDVHAGAAHGTALRRWGDYYGGAGQPRGAARRARAARLAARRRGGPRRAADDAAFAWSAAGAKRLKGMSEATQVWRCRRATG